MVSGRKKGDEHERLTLLTHEGETLGVREWSRRLGLSHQLILKRLASGWDVGRALTTPARKWTPRK